MSLVPRPRNLPAGILLGLSLVAGALPLPAAEGYLIIRNACPAPWTLKTAFQASPNVPATQVSVLDLTEPEPAPIPSGAAGLKPGYWTLQAHRTYCVRVRCAQAVSCLIGLGGSNRNYKLIQLDQVVQAGEPLTAVEAKGVGYQTFNAAPMAQPDPGEPDLVVTLEGPAHLTIRAENYPLQPAHAAPGQPASGSAEAPKASPKPDSGAPYAME